MNVLLISHGSALGGSPISLFNLYQYKKDKKINYYFCFGEDGPIVERLKKNKQSVYIIRKNRIFFGITMIFRFLFIILFYKIEILHLNTLTSYYKYPAIAAFLLRRKVIWFVRENPTEKRCRRLKFYINIFAHKVVTVSNDTARNLSYVENSLIETIYNGVDLNYFIRNPNAQNPKESKNSPYILTISSFEKRKGIIDAILAYKDSKIRQKCNYLIMGEDRSLSKEYYLKMLKIIKENSLQNKVFIVPPKEDVRPYLSNALFVVLVSYWEGLSRVLIESAAMGVPALASQNGGNNEVVIDRHNGMLVDAGNIKMISQNLDKMVEENCLSQYSLNTRKLAENIFDINICTEATEKLYKDLSCK